MATFVIPNVFAPNTVADANAVNANFTAVQNAINAGLSTSELISTVDLSALNWYNYFNFGALVNGGSAQNSLAFTEMLGIMAALNGGSGGGIAYIPAGTFPIAPGPYILPNQSVFQGAGVTVSNRGGQGGPGQTNLSMSGDGELFVFLTTDTPGGPKFRDIGFGSIGALMNTTTCFTVGLWSLSIQDCVFEGWPTVGNFQGLGTSMVRCVINYTGSLTNTTAVLLNKAIQCEISGPSEMIGNSVPGTSTFCMIGGGITATVHNTLRNLHITGWNYGVAYADLNGYGVKSGTQYNVIDGCLFECFKSSIYMVAGATNNEILGETISNCTISKSQASTDGSPIVFIDSGGGAASNIGPIMLANNLIFSNVSTEGVAQPNQYGVQIGTAGYVSIIGGQISQCGTVAGSDGSANVCISGSATNVILDSVNLSPLYAGSMGGSGTGAGGTQYALLISGTPTYVQVDSCPMLGFPGAPVKVTGSVSRMYITNCPGYNDVDTVVNATAPSGVGQTAANQGSAGGTSYYGPSLVTFVGNASGSTIHLNGTAYTLPASAFGAFTVNPYDQFYFSAAPTTFTWIGK